MSQSVESFVQVATDGSGKAIRNLAFLVLDSDGNVRTVYAQVTVPTDPNTGLALTAATKDLQAEILSTLRACVNGLAKLAECEPEELYDDG